MDRMGKPIIKNSQLLCSNCMEEKNIHNRLVTAIPEGCEDELEIATNLFNINNILADRELEKVEYIYDFEYYGRCFNEENYNKLKPFIALCRVLNAMHKKYENTDNYTEIIKMCKFLEEEIRYNLDRTY